MSTSRPSPSLPDSVHAMTGGLSPWLVAGVVAIATFMEVLDTSIANVALPHIAGNLSSSTEESTWVLTSYLVANAVAIPISGWLSTIAGRKRYFIGCTLIFTLASALCGMADSLGMLVFFRVLQGLGGGGLQPSVQAVLVDLFPGKKRGMAMALYTVCILVAPVLGPTMGGWITDNYSWRWIFYINVPVGAFCLIASEALLIDPPYLVARRMAMRSKKLQIDFVGLGLISLGLACTEILLDKGQQEDWFSSNFIVTLAIVGGVALLLAIVWELDHPFPILNLRLLRERNFAICCTVAMAVYAVLFACNVLLPQLMQNLMGYSPTMAGMVMSPGGIFTMLLVPFVGVMLTRGVDPRLFIGLGLLISGGATIWMSKLNLQVGPGYLVWVRVVQACGAGMMFVPLSTIAFRFLPREESSNASALYALVRNEGSSIGVALVTTLLTRGSQVHQAMLAQHVSVYDPAALTTLSQMAHLAPTADPTMGPRVALNLAYATVLREATMLSYVDQFFRFGLLIIVVSPIVLLLRRAHHDPKAGPTEVH